MSKATDAKKGTTLQDDKSQGESVPGTEVAVNSGPGTDLATQDDAAEFANDVGGSENVTARDVSIPRLTILQSLSPQLKATKPEYIPEAKEGDFCDTSCGDLWRGEMLILPCYFVTNFIEWSPERGKAPVANHGANPAILDKTKPGESGKRLLENGNIIAETMQFYVLNLSAGGRRSFLPLAATQLKPGRDWNAKRLSEKLSDGREPPLFYRAWKATPAPRSNDKGDWFVWKFASDRKVTEIDPSRRLLAAARDFADQCRRGLVHGDLSDDGTGETGRGSSSNDKNAPF
jgi:hypothetical protein